MEAGEREIRAMSTPELVRHALDEAKLLARAEVLHAKAELRDELRQAKQAGGFIGAAVALALGAISVLLVALAISLPLTTVGGLLVVAAAALLLAGACGWYGYRKLPKKPLVRTKERLKDDWTFAREQMS